MSRITLVISFITREKANHQILARLEKLLSDYFNSDDF